jgi:glycosyltransferase involved in cell wall biosynthesis
LKRPDATKRLRLAIIGARGIANYGGFESYMAELAPRLAEAGLDVTCGCEMSTRDNPATFKGVKLSYFPFLPPTNYTLRKLFEILYDIYFVLKCDYDVVYGLGVYAGPFFFFPRLLGKVSIVNIDGKDWARSKYTRFEQFLIKFLYLLSEISASKIAIDSRAMTSYIPNRLRGRIVYAPYGTVAIQDNNDTTRKIEAAGKEFEPMEYWLVVARLEPENNLEMIIRGYAASGSGKPLVLVGNPTSEEYLSRLRGLARELGVPDRVVFTGGIYDRPALDRLRHGCFAYLHGHSVGGTNPSLLEIMRMSKLVLAFDTPFNREVGEESLLYFRGPEDLAELIIRTEKSKGDYLPLEKLAKRRVLLNYDWSAVMGDYHSIFGLS